MNKQHENNPYAAPDHGLEHHEPGEIDNKNFQYMGFWKRFVAFVIDNVILSVAFYPLLIVLQLVIKNPQDASFIYLAITFVPVLVIVILFWNYKQSTPGKMIFSGKIVDAQTLGKPSVGKYVLRYFAYFLSSLALGLGFIWIAFDKRKRGWHDLISGTIVITPGEITNLQDPGKRSRNQKGQ